MAANCPVCQTAPEKLLYRTPRINVLYCQACGIGLLADPPRRPETLYSNPDYYAAWWLDKSSDEAGVVRVKTRTADWVLDRLKPLVPPPARLLEVGCAFGYFLGAAKNRGYSVRGIEISPAAAEAVKSGFDVRTEPLESLAVPGEPMNAVVMVDVLEHVPDPNRFLAALVPWFGNKPGVLAVLTPDIGSVSRRILGPKWTHFKEEHLFYYTRAGLGRLLARHGFEVLRMTRAVKGTSLKYIAAYGLRYGNLSGPAARFISRLPFASKDFMYKSDIFCLARFRPNGGS